MEEVSVIDFWASPFGMRVRIALVEKGIDHKFIEENMMNAERSSLLLKMNPIHKKIPVLIHGGRPICESLIIIQYIDEVWNYKATLIPSDPLQRSHARFWVDFIDKKVYACINGLWRNKGEAVEATKREFIETFKVLEAAMGDKPYLGGDSFGLVDISLIPFAAFFNVCETFGTFSIEEELPKIAAWTKRCKERESVAKVLPEPSKVFEIICLARKLKGIE